jgi:hypothetical protein
MIIRFVDIGGIFYHHYANFLIIIKCLDEIVSALSLTGSLFIYILIGTGVQFWVKTIVVLAKNKIQNFENCINNLSEPMKILNIKNAT